MLKTLVKEDINFPVMKGQAKVRLSDTRFISVPDPAWDNEHNRVAYMGGHIFQNGRRRGREDACSKTSGTETTITRIDSNV